MTTTSSTSGSTGLDDLGFSKEQEEQIVEQMVLSVGVPRVLKAGLEQQAKMKELLAE